jgi:hypothetical protein
MWAAEHRSILLNNRLIIFTRVYNCKLDLYFMLIYDYNTAYRNKLSYFGKLTIVFLALANDFLLLCIVVINFVCQTQE